MDDEMGLLCLSCAWEGVYAETADDGPSWPLCCPLCGSDELAFFSRPVDEAGA